MISSALAGILRKQEELDQRLARIESTLNLPFVRPAAPPPVPVRLAPPPPPPPPSPPTAEPLRVPPPPQPTAPPVSPSGQLETSIGLTLINRVGVITLVLGIAFFFKWAVDNQWIGPAGRVELGILAGFLAIGAGDLLWRRKQQTFAQGVIATGICILYLAIYAAFDFYQLVPFGLAFAAMSGTTLMAGVLALRYDAVAIAMLGSAGGYLTPVLLNTGQDRPWSLFSYILLLDLAALILVRLRRWQPLEIFSAAGTIVLFGAWLSHSNQPNQVAGTFFALLFYVLYAATTPLAPLFGIAQFLAALALAALNERSPRPYFIEAFLLAAAGLVIAGRRRWRTAPSVVFASFWVISALFASSSNLYLTSRAIPFLGYTAGFLLFLAWIPWWFLVRREVPRTQDLAVLALNGAAYFGASYWLLNPAYHAWMGLFAVAVAAIHVGLGYQLWRRQPADQRDVRPVVLTVGVALTFLTLAAPIQFTAYRITMAWALEAAALSWIGARLRNHRAVFASAVIFALVLLRLAIVDAWIFFSASSYTLLWNQRFLTFALSAVCLWLAAKWVLAPAPLRLTFYLAGHLVLLGALTLEILGWAARSAAPENLVSVETISVSILYAIYSVVLVALGVITRTVVNRIAGLVLTGFVVLKLYLFDVWQLGRVYRTLAFVALGLLLLSTSFLYSHFRGLIESWWKNERA